MYKYTLLVRQRNYLRKKFLRKQTNFENVQISLQATSKLNFPGITPTWNAGDPGGVNWHKQCFWTLASICDLGQQGNLYKKDFSGITKVQKISKLGHGFKISLFCAICVTGLISTTYTLCPASWCCNLQTDCSQCSSTKCSAVQCSAVQCSSVQCSAVQCSAVQCSAVQCSSVQCSAVQFSAVQCSAVVYMRGSTGGESSRGDPLPLWADTPHVPDGVQVTGSVLGERREGNLEWSSTGKGGELHSLWTLNAGVHELKGTSTQNILIMIYGQNGL